MWTLVRFNRNLRSPHFQTSCPILLSVECRFVAASDSKSFKSMVSVMDEGIKDLELRVSSALETAEVKEQECFIRAFLIIGSLYYSL